MQPYRSSNDPLKILVGGKSKTSDQINCFWGTGHFLYTDKSYTSCRETSTECTLLARGNDIQFSPRGDGTRPSPTPAPFRPLTKDEILDANQKDLLTRHPDFAEVTSTREFAAWLDTQPAAIKKAAYHNAKGIYDLNESLMIIEAYKASAGIAGTARQSPPPQTPQQSSSDGPNLDGLWFLLGSFVAGAAQGYGESKSTGSARPIIIQEQSRTRPSGSYSPSTSRPAPPPPALATPSITAPLLNTPASPSRPAWQTITGCVTPPVVPNGPCK